MNTAFGHTFILLELALLSMFGFAADGRTAEPPAKPLVAFSGSNSRISEPSFLIIACDKEWSQVWASHLGTTLDDAYRPLFEIDFRRCSVIAIFKGKTPNTRGIQIDSVSESADSIKVQFTTLGYQSAKAAARNPPGAPFAFVVIPNSAKSIVIEEGVVTKRHATSQWQEVARLKANK